MRSRAKRKIERQVDEEQDEKFEEDEVVSDSAKLEGVFEENKIDPPVNQPCTNINVKKRNQKYVLYLYQRPSSV